jgi:hypothetical protein
MFRSILAAATLALATPALAITLIPAQPSAFDPVSIRITVDSCAFVPSTVRVNLVSNTFRVTQQPNACLVAGTPEPAEIRLGTLPTGDYRVDLYGGSQPTGTPAESLAFTVRDRPEIAVFPPPTRPIADYSGMWWVPQQSGWGLVLQQSPSNAMFGTLFVYGGNGQAEWFSLQGQWLTSTRWTGAVYSMTGPPLGSLYDPSQVRVSAVGTATLEFKRMPPDNLDGVAHFAYEIRGLSQVFVLQRLGF